ncbi:MULTISPECIES: hypothetical protein [Acidobacteriaceae]|uniref:hypothetical protein n=1 Tax=Acidobacteriaceae TaxID=204434 RepID=UPI001C2055F0|nr:MULTISPECIES: hypothetical protein [Acidobacteriaceae]MDW5267610.1 hypothetical protein [Edaphobacter sp.]
MAVTVFKAKDDSIGRPYVGGVAGLVRPRCEVRRACSASRSCSASACYSANCCAWKRRSRYLPQTAGIFAALNRLGKSVLTVVLFLIGTGITLKEVGVRPLIQGVTLWIVVASISLWAIHAGWMAL